MVLNDYRLRSDFALTRRSYRSCINCSVKWRSHPQDLSEQPEGVQHAWYRMLEEDFTR